MANTTNFGWETPDDTDLVKDGAAAIRTLAGAIDTSLVDLKGGTTGQVLAKNSNTDMDFVWSADASGIPATIFDAKGDLIVASAADTAARLAVGTNGYYLSANSSATNGLQWVAPPSSGALTLISSTTYSSSSAHSVNDVFSSTYDNYLILINTDSASTGADMYMRLRVSGSDNSNSDYYWSNMGNSSSNSAFDGATSGGAATSWRINYSDDTNGSTGTIHMRNPYLSLVTSYSNNYLGIENNISYAYTGGGRTTNTTSYTGFTIYPNSGTFSGKVRVYGYANS